MANTPNVAAPLWGAAEASPWLNSAMRARIFDAFAVGVIVERMDLAAPPGACADGARYLVAGSASGAWTGHTGDLAIAVGANASNGWVFAEVGLQGMLIYNRADARNYRYLSGVWTAFVDALSRFQDLLDVTISGLADGDVFVWDASNGLLFPQTVSNLVSPFLTGFVTATLDTDGTLAANSDTRVASQKAVKTAIAAAVTGLLDLKGSQDCSGNPNYPAASKGDAYVVTVAGKIGGASGTSVDIGDVFFATADNAGGTQAGVGSSWDLLEHNLVGALLSANNLSDVTSAATARGNLGATTAGGNLFTLTNPSAITFLRVNADNSVSALSAASFRTAIGAGTGGGDVVSTNNLSDLTNAGTARTNLGATTVGSNVFTLTNPGAITFLRVNADNSVSALSAASFRTAIGAGTGGGDVVSTNNLSDLANANTALNNLGGTTVGENFFKLANPGAVTFPRINADNTVDALSAAAFRAAIGAGTATRLQDLSDVDTSSLADGLVLKWDASNGVFYFAQDIGWPFATAADIRGGTEAQRTIAPDQLAAAAAPQTLTDAATINWDMALGFNAKVTLGGNRTLAVANPQLGQTYSLNVTQDGTGTRIMTWPGSFDWGTTGAPVLTTTINKRDRITLFCTDAVTPKFDAFLSGKGFS